MELHIATDAEQAAATGARRIADLLRAAIEERGAATLAVSGGTSPLPMFRALASQRLDWSAVTIFQVDERAVAADDPASNRAAIERLLVTPTGARAELFECRASMTADELAAEARRVEALLAGGLGVPPVFDVVHLGLGTDGHTASWPPDHPVLDELDETIAVVPDFGGHDRLTLTPPVIDEARSVVWFVAGEDKRTMLIRLMAGDPDIPAGRVASRHQIIVSAVDRRSSTR